MSLAAAVALAFVMYSLGFITAALFGGTHECSPPPSS